ncbi:MAG: hypothetical protein ACRD5L_14925 [Bryobacteraceae bacterium]
MEALTSGWLGGLVLVWTILTVLWLLLLGYRGVVANREEDQLFIGHSEDHLAKEQQEIVGTLTRLSKPLWALGISSGALFLVILVAWVWQGMQTSF